MGLIKKAIMFLILLLVILFYGQSAEAALPGMCSADGNGTMNFTSPNNLDVFPYSTNVQLSMNSTGLADCNCTINGTNNLNKVVKFECGDRSGFKLDIDYDGDYNATCQGGISYNKTVTCTSGLNFSIDRAEHGEQKASSGSVVLLFLCFSAFILLAFLYFTNFIHLQVAFFIFTFLLFLFGLNFSTVLLREWVKVPALISLLDTLNIISVIFLLFMLLYVAIILIMNTMLHFGRQKKLKIFGGNFGKGGVDGKI